MGKDLNIVNDKPLFDSEAIEKMAVDVAAKVNATYQDEKKPIVLMGILNGAIPFLAEVMKHITLPCLVDTIRVESYDGQNQGVLRLAGQPKEDTTDRVVILLDDIVDTGNTMTELALMFKGIGDAREVALAAMLKRHSCPIEVDFVGAVIEDDVFVYGFGLDSVGGLNRNLREIRVEK